MTNYEIMVQRYPGFFASCAPECGPGWAQIIMHAASFCEGKAEAEYVKEKYGSLRIGLKSFPESPIDAYHCGWIIGAAEVRSEHTCDQCGSRGKMMSRHDIYAVRCEEHQLGEPK